MKFALVYLLLSLMAISAQAQWIKQSVNTNASLRGLSVVNENVVWASGTGGTVIRTIDGGKKWDVITVPGAEKLDFRDIEAFDANTAYILSIGNGESSRIYKTTDGGVTWRQEFQNTDSKAFYDAIACWDSEHCLAMSDPVDGSFLVNVRSPADPGVSGFHRKGVSWVHAVRRVTANDGEAAFAASGTCLITQGKNNAFLVTGGSAARVFRTTDRGLTWAVADTPIVHGTAGSGIFSIAMVDAKRGVIVGGDYEKPQLKTNNLAFTKDGGRTWVLGGGLYGYRSGIAFFKEFGWVAVGTSGSDFSSDGKRWTDYDKENYNSVRAKANFAWAVGPKGLVSRIELAFTN